MSSKISNMPALDIEVALCQTDLKRDRREIRATRALMDERRVRAAEERAEDAFVTKSVGSMVDVFRTAIHSAESLSTAIANPEDMQRELTSEERKSAIDGGCADATQDALKKAREEGAGQLDRDAAQLRGAGMGEDAPGKSSEKMSTQLSKLKRSRSSVA